MDTWESFFREKSERRWLRHTRRALVRRAILAVLVGSVAVAAVMLAAGWPR
jgi:hypothetical protein